MALQPTPAAGAGAYLLIPSGLGAAERRAFGPLSDEHLRYGWCTMSVNTPTFDHEGAAMVTTLWAVIRDGKVELLERQALPEGARVLVTLLPDDDMGFWQQASHAALDRVWDNDEDDRYAALLDP